MIPKIIHYCWFGDAEPSDKMKKCMSSWKKYCKDYKIICWNEENIDFNHIAYLKEAYEEKKWSFVSDVVRLIAVSKYGGIYLDTDVELVNNLDSLLSYKGYFGFEEGVYINTGLGFGAEKDNVFVKAMLEDYGNRHFKENGMMNMVPCPHLNTEVLEKMGLKRNGTFQIIDGTAFLPTEYLCPLDYQTGKIKMTDNTISIHHYNSSWMTEDDIRKREIFMHYQNRYGLNAGKILASIKIYGISKSVSLLIRKIVG